MIIIRVIIFVAVLALSVGLIMDGYSATEAVSVVVLMTSAATEVAFRLTGNSGHVAVRRA